MQEKSRKKADNRRVIVHDVLSLIDFVYWHLAQPQPKPCKGFELTACEDCRHFEYCKRRDLVKGAIEERLLLLEEAEDESEKDL